MWNAKVRYAMLAYENAQHFESKKDPEKAALNLVLAYNLYKKAIEVKALEIFSLFILSEYFFLSCFAYFAVFFFAFEEYGI